MHGPLLQKRRLDRCRPSAATDLKNTKDHCHPMPLLRTILQKKNGARGVKKRHDGRSGITTESGIGKDVDLAAGVMNRTDPRMRGKEREGVGSNIKNSRRRA